MRTAIRSALVLAILLQASSGFAARSSSPTDMWGATPLSVARQPETVVLEVSGLWATLCDRYLEHALVEPLEGVDRVEADHESDTVTVSFDPERLTPEEIAAAIENCPFFDVTGSPTHALNRAEIKRPRRCWCCFANRDA